MPSQRSVSSSIVEKVCRHWPLLFTRFITRSGQKSQKSCNSRCEVGPGRPKFGRSLTWGKHRFTGELTLWGLTYLIILSFCHRPQHGPRPPPLTTHGQLAHATQPTVTPAPEPGPKLVSQLTESGSRDPAPPGWRTLPRKTPAILDSCKSPSTRPAAWVSTHGSRRPWHTCTRTRRPCRPSCIPAGARPACPSRIGAKGSRGTPGPLETGGSCDPRAAPPSSGRRVCPLRSPWPHVPCQS